uniref:PH domain-containing protein n=2 Tax=Octactis speculum TaxID=3111310 RepID=A0A7S2G608_9STRA|mmetsp:Transcript_39745/g.54085  ORF Transcript_39745/g.54085 Transcript_39745/m.54085 type:complete len:191 (+) Transcript_39745:188-760(+)
MGELVEDDIPPPNAPIELNWEFQSTDEAAAETEPIQAMNTLVTAQSIGKGSSALSTMATPPEKRRPTWSATQNASEPLTGFLFKKSTGRAYGVNKSWKKRFFELDKRNFSWYKDHSRSSFRRTVTEKDEKSIQFTKDMVCRTTDEKAHRFAIFRKTAEEEVIISRFAASNKSERDLWVMRIQNAIENFSD